MVDYVEQAIQQVNTSKISFCKFLAANDTGLTGGHQAGIYISKAGMPILFSEPGIKGINKDRWVKIKWFSDRETDTRFLYYGQGTRNEYRITNFGKDFPYLRPEYTGALFVLIQNAPEDYIGYIFNSDYEIETFLSAFGMSATETNRLIESKSVSLPDKEERLMNEFIMSLSDEFPSSEQMSSKAREIQDEVYNHKKWVIDNPDKKLIAWTDQEYRLFRAIESYRYGEVIKHGFSSVEDFIGLANQVLNRRKSRAGKSLEHHLEAMFIANQLEFQAQAITEGNKRPDFLFPSEKAYHDMSFSSDKIISLAAKTTCKDRWRQVINEADRLRGKTKFLCTLQQGVSEAQMDEMKSEKVTLVVPKQYISAFPPSKQSEIWTVRQFIEYVKEVENG